VSRHNQKANLLTTCKRCLDLSDLAYGDIKYHLKACHSWTICSPNHLQRWLQSGVMPYHTKQQKMGLHSPTLRQWLQNCHQLWPWHLHFQYCHLC
jgi:hypothetical protein